MSGGLLACWPWKGAKSTKRSSRRGHIQVGGRGSRTVSAARVALALTTDGDYDKRGADGELLDVLHKCHNGGNEIDCVNPAHLEWGTRAENIADKASNPKRIRHLAYLAAEERRRIARRNRRRAAPAEINSESVGE
jgi:hypothetical protein